MSVLIGHAKALDALGRAFDHEAERASREPTRDLLYAIGSAHHMAADDLRDQMKKEAGDGEASQ